MSEWGLRRSSAWGCVYYPVSIAAPMIARDLGLAPSGIYAIYATLLLASAVVAPTVGRAIDRHGGRMVLSAGSLLAAGALLATATVDSVFAYATCSALLGIAAAMTLYDAAFPALVEAAGAQGRRAITLVTFMGGFASSVSWPLTAALCDKFGWRATYVFYAVLLVVVCLPIHLLALPRRAPATRLSFAPVRPAPAADAALYLSGRARRRALVLLALTVAANQLVASGFLIHIIDFGTRAGLGMREAVVVGMLFGPAQVLARAGEMAVGKRFSALTTGRLATLFLPLGLCLVLVRPANLATAALFAIALGLSNGLMTIARGTVSLALFGPSGFGEVTGQISVPALIARACGPFLFAVLIEDWGVRATVSAGLFVALLAAMGMERVAALHRHQSQAAGDAGP